MRPRRWLVGLWFTQSVASNIFSTAIEKDILCRAVMEDTIYVGGKAEERLSCIVITNGREEDDLLPILSIPKDLEEKLVDKHLLIKNATLSDDEIRISSPEQISIQDRPPQRLRGLSLSNNKGPIIGKYTLAVVRISTRDNPSAYTRQELFHGTFAPRQTNVMSQFKACSFGKLQWRPAQIGRELGVISVDLPYPSRSYKNDRGKILKAAQEWIRSKYNLQTVSQLADRVFMCLPPNSGNFLASAGMNHFRAQFNTDWCLSLTANMHELGHTIGLHHANLGDVVYADATGYMAGGSKDRNGPHKCFNGYNNWKLGFYRDRQFDYNPFKDGPKQIPLATFVDYDKTRPGHYVLVSISRLYFLQFNRAKGFNNETGHGVNQLTVHQKMPGGSTDRVAALDIGQQFIVQDFLGLPRRLVVRVCFGVRGPPEALWVSMGLDQADCAQKNNPSQSLKTRISRPTSTKPWRPKKRSYRFRLWEGFDKKYKIFGNHNRK